MAAKRSRFITPTIRRALVSKNAISFRPMPIESNTSRRLITGPRRICGCCWKRWWKKSPTGSWPSESQPPKPAPSARRSISAHYLLNCRASVSDAAAKEAFHRNALQISLFAAIHTARRRRFMHDDFAKTGAARLQFFPEPRRHIFDRRILSAGDFVEIGMIELLDQRL